MPIHHFSVTSSVAGVVRKPCETNCQLPNLAANWCELVPRCQLPEKERRANASEMPWLALSIAPEPPRETLAPSKAPPRIAVCMAGNLRTMTHPAVYRSIHDFLLRDGPAGPRKHDLFAVLGTATGLTLRVDDLRVESPAALASALSVLNPRRTRFVNEDEAEAPCGHAANRQFAKWAQCVDLVEDEEARARAEMRGGGRKAALAGTGGHVLSPTKLRAPVGTTTHAAPFAYDYILKTRPDMMWVKPLRIAQMAARVPADDIVLHTNDWHVLWPRRHWPTLAALKSIQCDEACLGDGVAFQTVTTGSGEARQEGQDYANEYCLLQAHLAHHGARSLEVSHPSEPWLLMFHDLDNLAYENLRYKPWEGGGSGTIARWDEGAGPPRRIVGRGTSCVGQTAADVRCEECAQASTEATEGEAPAEVMSAAGHVATLRSCPVAGTVEAEMLLLDDETAADADAGGRVGDVRAEIDEQDDDHGKWGRTANYDVRDGFAHVRSAEAMSEATPEEDPKAAEEEVEHTNATS